MSQTISIKFVTLDYRGREGFPTGPKGLVYHHENVVGGRVRDFYVRTDTTDKGWRIDHREFGINVAVYGHNGESYFESEHEAALALEQHLTRRS